LTRPEIKFLKLFIWFFISNSFWWGIMWRKTIRKLASSRSNRGKGGRRWRGSSSYSKWGWGKRRRSSRHPKWGRWGKQIKS